MVEKWKRTIQIKSKGKKRNRRVHEAESKHTETEWVLCSENWRDIVIMYVPQINNIPIKIIMHICPRWKSGRHINRTKEEHRRE